jgi:prolyl-tRNA editing enzyme YbaK/EbsC (Cys-tRNA(Pro) deacylase)
MAEPEVSPNPRPLPAAVDMLERLGIAFDVVACDPALSDTAAFSAAYGYAPEQIANTIVVRSRSDPPVYAACVVLASTRLDVNGTVRRRLGVRKASFASAEESTAFTGMPPGGISPFGLPRDTAIWMDDRVVGVERLIVGSGERSSKLLVRGEALVRISTAEVVAGLAVERAVKDEAER